MSVSVGTGAWPRAEESWRHIDDRYPVKRHEGGGEEEDEKKGNEEKERDEMIDQSEKSERTISTSSCHCCSGSVEACVVTGNQNGEKDEKMKTGSETEGENRMR